MRNFLTNTNNDFRFFDDFFDSFFKPMTFSNKVGHMRADVKENENGYELLVDLPGFEKKDINLNLKNGYLNIEAKQEQKEQDGENYIRRERTCYYSRSFYVGENLTEEDIEAKYNNGTLSLKIPKAENKELPQKNIEIK